MFKKLGMVVVTVLVISLLSPSLYALTNEEKLELLEEKFLEGKIDQDLYKELRKKYQGGTAGVSKTEVKAKPIKEVPGNLVKNWSMEEDNDGDLMPDNWQKWGFLPGVVIGLDPKVKQSGGKSVCLQFPPTSADGGICQTIKVKPGKIYLLSCWLKGENLTDKYSFLLMASCHSTKPGEKDTKPKVAKKEFYKVKGSFDWRKMVAKTEPLPEDAQYLKIYMRNYAPTGLPANNKTWIDDVVVVPVN